MLIDDQNALDFGPKYAGESVPYILIFFFVLVCHQKVLYELHKFRFSYVFHDTYQLSTMFPPRNHTRYISLFLQKSPAHKGPRSEEIKRCQYSWIIASPYTCRSRVASSSHRVTAGLMSSAGPLLHKEGLVTCCVKHMSPWPRHLPHLMQSTLVSNLVSGHQAIPGSKCWFFLSSVRPCDIRLKLTSRSILLCIWTLRI